MKKIILALLCLLALNVSARTRQCFDRGWRFILADNPSMKSNKYDDSSWRKLNLPHDWAVEGDFSKDNPSGTGGGALPGGIGWYRKHFTISVNDKSAAYYIDFDGVYMNSQVYINGHLLGQRPYGYSSFQYDMTPYIIKGRDNVIAVRVDNNDQPNSRWYSGCGIYRHTYLTKTSNVHVAHWGTQVTTDNITEKKAYLILGVYMGIISGSERITVSNVIKNPFGKEVGRCDTAVTVSSHRPISILKSSVTVPTPQLWTLEKPYMYTMVTNIYQGKQLVDTYETPFGIRSFKFDAHDGFSLNGKRMKLNGVCDHHDLGCLGAALNEDALHRQLVMLKNMGCNAIRCSHNPPAPELLNMCDTMGFIVMDESYDIWRKKKTAHDYARFFDEWYARDLGDMVLRDRNHPSIMIWSIGNEVLEQWSDVKTDTLSLEQANMILNFGHDASTLAKDGEMSINSLLTRRLAQVVKGLDPTRPVTAGCNEPSPNNHLFKSGAIDIIGYNYHIQNIPDVPKLFPGKPFMMTESVSALQTRGYYKMPSDSIYICPPRWDKPYYEPSLSCSSYDNCHAPWSSTHEETWDVVKHNDFVCGQFIWTGFDYLGEPTPYPWPARSSYFGIIDLAGFPKDIYYMYQSEWTTRPVLHLFPHWNWTPGQTIDLWAYYNDADSVELFVNGASQGFSSKTEHKYHASWRVKYQPGEVKAVAYRNGVAVRSETIRTAGEPYAIRLTPDRTVMRADGKSLTFVKVEIVDKNGILCPNADNEVQFSIQGSLDIAGVDNGSETSLERFKANHRKAFFGKCLIVLQSTDQVTTATLTASSKSLRDATCTITTTMK
jgi:beta-galactosidase